MDIVAIEWNLKVMRYDTPKSNVKKKLIIQTIEPKQGDLFAPVPQGE